MEAVVRNTAIQGWLSVIFVVLSIIVIATAILATAKAFRNHQAGIPSMDHEDQARPSRVFAPAGLIPTPAERELMAEWNKVPADLRFEKARHH
jgi:carbon starvation protein